MALEFDGSKLEINDGPIRGTSSVAMMRAIAGIASPRRDPSKTFSRCILCLIVIVTQMRMNELNILLSSRALAASYISSQRIDISIPILLLTSLRTWRCSWHTSIAICIICYNKHNKKTWTCKRAVLCTIYPILASVAEKLNSSPPNTSATNHPKRNAEILTVLALPCIISNPNSILCIYDLIIVP